MYQSVRALTKTSVHIQLTDCLVAMYVPTMLDTIGDRIWENVHSLHIQFLSIQRSIKLGRKYTDLIFAGIIEEW